MGRTSSPHKYLNASTCPTDCRICIQRLYAYPGRSPGRLPAPFQFWSEFTTIKVRVSQQRSQASLCFWICRTCSLFLAFGGQYSVLHIACCPRKTPPSTALLASLNLSIKATESLHSAAAVCTGWCHHVLLSTHTALP